MVATEFLKRVVVALTVLIWFAPGSALADHGNDSDNQQEDRQEDEEAQKQLSANNTGYKGATMLSSGSEAFAEGITTPNDDTQVANMSWSGDTLNLTIKSEETGNKVEAQIEFFWFESGKDRSSDFYVAIIRSISNPNLGGDCLTYTDIDKTSWQLGVDRLAQYINVQPDPTGQGGTIRWDWSSPYETYRYEPKNDVTVKQHLDLKSVSHVNGEVEGSSGVKADDKNGSGETKYIQGKADTKNTIDAKHRVETEYTVTLYRWQVQVNASSTGIEWGLMPLDPKKASDNAYHEYYLVMQSKSPGEPVVIPKLEFGGTFQCPRSPDSWQLNNRHEKLEAEAQNIRLSLPPVPDCSEDEELRRGECVPRCSDGHVYRNGQCEPECGDGEVYENGSCQTVDHNNSDDSGDDSNGCQRDSECSPGNICQSGSCVSSECTRSNDCKPDEVCDLGRCKKVECTSDSDCNSGEECSSEGTCVAKSDSVDAGIGPDTGFPDGGRSGANQHQTEYNGGCAAPDGDSTPPLVGIALLFLLGLARRLVHR